MTDGEDEDEDDDGLVTVLWGTTVTIGASMKAFEWFLKDFTCGDRQGFDPWRLEQVRLSLLSTAVALSSDDHTTVAGPQEAH